MLLVRLQFILLSLSLLPQFAQSQFESSIKPLNLSATFSKKDSFITINYINNTNKEILLWVGDWQAAYLERNFEYSYLLKDFKNCIYFKSKKNKLVNNFLNYYDFLDSAAVVYSHNFKVLFPNESFNILIKSTIPLKRKTIKKTDILILYSIVDISNLCLYLNNKKVKSSFNRSPCFFENANQFYSSKFIRLQEIYSLCGEDAKKTISRNNTKSIIDLDLPVNRVIGKEIPLQLVYPDSIYNTSPINIKDIAKFSTKFYSIIHIK